MKDSELERCIKLYRKSVLAAALCYVRNPSDADDITQDVFFRLYTYEGSFESDEHIRAWLLRCAVNRSKNLLHSHWHKNSRPLDDAQGLTHYDKEPDSGAQMLGYLRSISRSNRITLYMFYYEGFTTDEIAHILGISVTAVTSRLRRGRQQLKKLLENERNDTDDGIQRFF